MAHASSILGAGDGSQDGHVVLIFIASLEFLWEVRVGISMPFFLEKFLIPLGIPWDANL
jgi:hypothetical protein